MRFHGLRNSLGYFSHVKHLTIDIDIDIDISHFPFLPLLLLPLSLTSSTLLTFPRISSLNHGSVMGLAGALQQTFGRHCRRPRLLQSPRHHQFLGILNLGNLMQVDNFVLQKTSLLMCITHFSDPVQTEKKRKLLPPSKAACDCY